MQHQPDTDAQMGDQAVAVTSTHSESQVTLWPNTLGDFPTDPANFRDTRITAEKRAEIVRRINGGNNRTSKVFVRKLVNTTSLNFVKICPGFAPSLPNRSYATGYP